jgi:hypothetical protein
MREGLINYFDVIPAHTLKGTSAGIQRQTELKALDSGPIYFIFGGAQNRRRPHRPIATRRPRAAGAHVRQTKGRLHS